VAPWHCEFRRHWTHRPALHTSPPGQGWVAVHPGTQALALHSMPDAQSPVARQATQARVAVSHRGVGAAHSPSTKHATHALVAASHTVPAGQVPFASQPGAHALATQRCPAAQSADVMHPTHAVWARHFSASGQSAFAPHSTHAPLTHTCPVEDVAQSPLDMQAPAAASTTAVVSGVVSGVAVTSLLLEASRPDPTSGAPPAEHPEGRRAMVTRHARRTKQSRERRSRTIRTN
jgi:hypothetical protein